MPPDFVLHVTARVRGTRAASRAGQRRGRRAWWCRRLQDCRDGWKTARELQNHPHGQEPCGATRTESTRPMRRERARVGSAPGRGAAGRGQGGGAWLPQPTARRCWMRGRYITYFSLNRKQPGDHKSRGDSKSGLRSVVRAL